MISYLWKAADWARHRARQRSGVQAYYLGRRGEDMAHRSLEKRGYVVVARNHRLTSGAAEIDIVARDGRTLVFVEVKARSTDEYGAPDRAIGIEKQRHMLRAALDYARRASVDWQDIRFDIVTVVFSDPPRIQQFTDVLPLRMSPGHESHDPKNSQALAS